MSLARTALLASDNDLPGALQWLTDQAAASGAIKAAKLSSRLAEEGLVGVVLTRDGMEVNSSSSSSSVEEGMKGGGVRGAMVELGCETDFVARTEEFRLLLEDVTRSIAFFAEPFTTSSSSSSSHNKGRKQQQLRELEWNGIKDIPILPRLEATSTTAYSSTNQHGKIETIKTSIAAIVSRLGENISLKRAISLAIEDDQDVKTLSLASTYSHGSKAGIVSTDSHVFQSGTLASLLLFNLPRGVDRKVTLQAEGLKSLTRSLARQVVAVPTLSVNAQSKVEPIEGEMSTALYDQPLITMASNASFEFEAGSNVKTVLQKWSESRNIEGNGIQVVEVARWTVGGGGVEAEN